MRSGILSAFIVSFGVLAFTTTASANSPQGTVYNIGPGDNWFDTIACDSCAASDLLQPGDIVNLAPGNYSDARRINIFSRGTAEHPITIRAADPNNRPVFSRPIDPTKSRNHVLNLEGAQYLTLDGVEVTGGAWGIRIGSTYRPADPGFFPNGISDRGPLPQDDAKFITIQNSKVYNTGANAITANMDGDRYEGMIFRNNEISDTGIFGEGFYLGCNNNDCQFFDGLIEGNYIYDTNTTTPNIRTGDGIEVKYGSYNNIVRNNVIRNTVYPGILAYGTAGNGARNIFEGNVIWDTGEQGIQIAADAIIRNNIVITNGENAFRAQNHQGATPGNLTIVNNTFIADGTDALRIANSVTDSILIANNAIYSRSNRAIRLPSLNNVTLDSNVGSGSVSPSIPTSGFDPSGNIATDFVDLDWSGPGLNAFPALLSKLIGAGNSALQSFVDFNGTSRAGSATVGAYVFNLDGNPGWQIAPEFKAVPLPGDFDGDDDVDGADFLALQRGFGSTFDADDLTDWVTNYGSVAVVGAAAAVPEPSAIVLALVVGCGLLGTQRKR